MKDLRVFDTSLVEHGGIRPSPPRNVTPGADVTEERLPFTLRQVSDANDLHRAVDLRHRAYARHLPGFADALRVPETDDTEEGVLVLIAESKVDGSILGTVRIQTNLINPLNMEQSIDLPEWLNGKSIAEVRRLAVAPGTAGRLVKMVLLKAVYQYCAQNNLEWILVAARRPLDMTYEKLTLEDVLDGRTFIPIPRENNVPHRVLGLETQAFHDRLVAAKHPLLNFFFYTQHPDIHPSCTVPPSSRRMAVPTSRLTAIQ
jgi:hypothetical protein